MVGAVADTSAVSSFREHLETPGRREPEGERRFLSIWFRCCGTYGRAYRNASGTSWVARCPRCGGTATAPIGPAGSRRNVFIVE
jgi:hypothetical protein